MVTKVGNEVTLAQNDEQVVQVKNIREVRVNYRGPKLSSKHISDAQVVSDYVRRILPDNSREHIIVLYLDGAHHVVCYAIVSTGTCNYCHVHPREVFQRAVLVGATAIVMSHNHPSGSPEPSEDDRKVTRLVKDAGDLLGIKLLDHVIVTSDSMYSFGEHGEL